MKLLITNLSRRWIKQAATAAMFVFIAQAALADVTWTTGPIAPGDYTSSGIVTINGNLTFQAGTYTFSSLVINSGMTVTMQANTGTNTGVVINATDINVAGTMNAAGQGFTATNGPVPGANGGTYGAGGGHGGSGSNANSGGAAGGSTWGSAAGPVTLGSGGGNGSTGTGGTGGGAIRLTVSGTLTVTGTISANGNNGTSTGGGGGAGGSIWITAGTFAGNGTVRANGGNGANFGGGGGGGRILITYSTSNTYSGLQTVSVGTGGSGGTAGSLFARNSTTNDIYCTQSSNTVFAGSDFPSPLGTITVVGPCSLTVTGTTSAGSASITSTGSLNIGGDMTLTGDMTLSTGNVVMLGNTGSGVGYTLTAANVNIDSSSTFSANGQGYGTASGSGAGASDSGYGGGGGYGGSGGTSATSAVGGGAYGSILSPTHLGSGGGSGGNGGGAGGGAIKLVVSGTLTVAGALTANGGTAPTWGGGGSGGSIWLTVGTLAGAGSIRANGSNGASANSGGGGGGRISVKYTSTSTYSGVWSVSPGTGYGSAAAAGTIILISSSNDLTCSTASTLSLLASDLPTPMGALSISGTCKLTLTGDTSFSSISVTANGSTLTSNGNITATGDTNLTSSAAMTVTGNVNTNNLNVLSSSTMTVTGNITMGASLAINTATLTVNGNVSTTTGDITLTTGTINLQGDTVTGLGYALSAANVNIDSGSTINANALGFPASQGPGAGGDSASSYSGGAGYGGVGGVYSFGGGGAAGATYGSAMSPNQLGSGGGSSGDGGGIGGGAIKIVASNTVTVAGIVTANGSNGPVFYGGGGSGGSIWISAGTIAGSGIIRANGGNGNASAGGGGGGRIFLGYTSANTYSGSPTASAGTGGTGATAGTILILNTSNNNLTCSSSATNVTLTSSDFTGSVGTVNISNGCKVTFNSPILTGAITITGSGSTLYLNGDLSSSGDVNLTTSAALVFYGNTITGLGYTLSAANISVDSTSSINANGQGFTSGTGPGAGGDNTSSTGGGAGYGGAGRAAGGTAGGTYGSSTNPTDLGSGGGSGGNGGGTGGGALRLVSSGTVTINGTVSANAGTTPTFGGGGSGGSVWISTATLAGSGTIRANGGAGATGVGHGGGGRIAGAYTTSTFSGTAQSNAGGTGAGAGTVVMGALGAAAKLYFTTQPSSLARMLEDFPTQPAVSAQDSNGNTVASFSGTITLAAYTDASCTTVAGGTLTSTTGTTLYGTGWFSGMDYSTANSTIYLKATSGALTTACSSSILVGGAAATKLVFTTQPTAGGTAAGVAFAQQPAVTAKDASNNADYVYSTTVTLSVYTDASCTTAATGGTLYNGTSSSISSGIASYSGTRYTKAGTYYFKASSGTLTTACSSSFIINPGTATQLVIATEPSTTATAGVNFAQQMVVEARDAYGNVDTTYSTAVTQAPYTNAGCSVAGTGTLSGSATTTSGVASYSGQNYTKSGNLYIKVTSGGLTSDCSTRVTVSAGAASQLAFTTQPSSTGVINVNLKVQPVVTAQDAYGNTVTTYTTAVTLGAYYDSGCTSPATGTLSGSATTTSGVASFSNVRHTDTGVGYLKASSGALTPACSTSVTLIPLTPMMFRGY